MPNNLSMSNTLFQLFCIQAENGRRIDLAKGGLYATYEQAKTLLSSMNGTGDLVLLNKGYSDCQAVEISMLGGTFAPDTKD